MALLQSQEKQKHKEKEKEEVEGDGAFKAPRLPRWTRQEILVLIQGKRVAENRVRRGRAAVLSTTANTATVEPKWATVSSYCKRHGVNRGPVQCRKRWSNLAGDFKKIKEWESLTKDEADSFWVMRNDLRRDRKLPGFFDREVFDILDGAPLSGPGPAPAVEVEVEVEEEDKGGGKADTEEDEAVFDSGRSAPPDDALFSDFETENNTTTTATPQKEGPSMAIPAPTPISEKQYHPFTGGGGTGPGLGTNEKQAAMNAEMGSTSHEGRKRRRFLEEDDAEGEGASLPDELVNVLERNGKILSAQLEAHNINLRLDREDRKDHTSSIVAVLNKLADALGKIADKL